ncbi:S-layer homology domain-containing protein [Crassaminicella profunda]|uniref:S-layer homology domain-containing protein n=1 Tax=Crassaminicella profunda TaxID=1286698 RepID=UPI001CA73EC4|nr:S-layer homology domain-containing protein [Crassaminicella profunda]QZY55272.1 S-layer homology domain-containing protein [Crassaminicella profunda]
MEIRKINRWLARLLIFTICLTGVPIKNVYGEGYENNKVTYQWKKILTHDRMGDEEEIQVEYLSPTRDGGFIGIGYDDYSGLIFKLDNARNLVWAKEYGGFGNKIADIQEKSSGGYVVLENRWWYIEGISGCNGYIFELDENGEQIPEKEFRVGGSDRDFVEQIVQTNDGGYIVVGYENSSDGDFQQNKGDYDCWVLKIDNNFNKVWIKNYGGEGQDKGVSIKEATDGGYVVFGTSVVIERPPDIPRNYNFWVFKIDEAGNVVWNKTYGGTKDDSSVSSDAIKPIDMQPTPDGGYALLGNTTINNGDITGNHGGKDYWFVKIDKDGEKQFQKTYGGSGNDSPIGFIKTSDGGYMIAGNSNSSDGDFNENQGNEDGWIIQVDESGEILWKWNVGTAQEDMIYCIQTGLEGGAIISSKIGGNNEIAKIYPGQRYLYELKMDDQDLSGFQENTFGYTVILPRGSTIVPTITAKALDMDATVNVIPAESLPGTTKVEIIKEEIVLKTYSIQFTLEKNTNAYLNDLKINDETVSDFVYNQYTYEKELPYGSTTVPIVTATAQDPNATVNITPAMSLPGTTRIEVIAEDGSTQNTYTIYFTVLKNTNAYLSDLKINNETVTDFVYNQYTYEVKLPVGSTSIPTVTAKTQDENAKVNITQATSVPGTASVKVTAEDGELLNIYSIYFTLDKSNNAYLKDIRIANQTVSDFVYNDYTYQVELPFGSTTVPNVTAKAQDENAKVNITQATSLPGTTRVEVTAEDGNMIKTYEINFVVKEKESGQDNHSNNNNSNSNSSSSGGSSNSQGEEAKVSPLEKPKESLKKSIETLKDTKENKEQIIKDVINTIKDVPKIMQEVDDPQDIVDDVTTMVENTEELLSDIDTPLEKREELKDAIVRLGEKAMEKVGQMQVPLKAIKVEGYTAKATISSQWLQKQIENTEKNMNSIKDALKKVVGEGAEEAKIALTVNMPKTMQNTETISVDFQREILTQIENKNIDRVIFNMKYVGFTVEPDTFKNVKEQEKITLEEVVDNQDMTFLPKDIEKVNNMPILEINAKVQDETIKSFKKPMEVYFNLSHLNLSKYSEEELESLTAYLYDEETNEWKAVGGTYDPATNRIHVYRIHLSTYTVMKSNRTFSDIKKHSSEKEINLLLKKGILEDENEFMPNKEVSREEFVGWVSKSFGLEEKEIEVPFKDVDRRNPNYKEIAAAFDQGLIQGKKDNVFDPKGNITKQEAAVAIANALKKYEKIKSPKDKNPYLAQYNDQENIASWSKDAVAMVSQKRLSGNNQNQYNPNESMTRADAALMVYNVRDRL